MGKAILTYDIMESCYIYPLINIPIFRNLYQGSNQFAVDSTKFAIPI